MSHRTRTTAAAELWVMPADGQQRELVAGDLRIIVPAGGRHGRIALRLGRRWGD